jgi:hypothetical protein
LAECSTESAPILEFLAQCSIHPEAARVKSLLERERQSNRWKPVLPFVHEKYSVVMKSGRVLEIASNIHLKFFGLNVRRTGCPCSFSVEPSANLPAGKKGD